MSPTEQQRSFNLRLKALRKEHQLTQDEVAQRIGVQRQTISKWENNGYPDPEFFVPIATLYGVSIDQLFGRAEMPSNVATKKDNGHLTRHIDLRKMPKFGERPFRVILLVLILLFTFLRSLRPSLGWVDFEFLGELFIIFFIISELIHWSAKLWQRDPVETISIPRDLNVSFQSSREEKQLKEDGFNYIVFLIIALLFGFVAVTGNAHHIISEAYLGNQYMAVFFLILMLLNFGVNIALLADAFKQGSFKKVISYQKVKYNLTSPLLNLYIWLSGLMVFLHVMLRTEWPRTIALLSISHFTIILFIYACKSYIDRTYDLGYYDEFERFYVIEKGKSNKNNI